MQLTNWRPIEGGVERKDRDTGWWLELRRVDELYASVRIRDSSGRTLQYLKWPHGGTHLEYLKRPATIWFKERI